MKMNHCNKTMGKVKMNKKTSIIIAIMMLISISIAVVPTVTADDTYGQSINGTLWINDDYSGPDFEVKIEVDDFNNTGITVEEVEYLGHFINFVIDIEPEHAGDTCNFFVKIGDVYYPPDINASIVIPEDTEFFVEISLNTSGLNDPPNTPSNPDPSNGETNVGINHDLSWTCSDPDGDSLTYDVYFGTTNPPTTLEEDGQPGTSYDPGTLAYKETYYWQIIAEDSYGATTSGPVWSFTTKEESPSGDDDDDDSSSSSSGGSNVGAPTADAGGPYFEFFFDTLGYSDVTFDGSGSYGSIASYSWNFGDGETGTGVSPTHRYTSADNYTVKLTVTGYGGSSSDTTYALLTPVGNNNPTDPTVTGPDLCSLDSACEFGAISTDEDGHQIKYTFDWGDTTDTTTTGLVANNTQVNESHNWTSTGIFELGVTATDEVNGSSGTTKKVVFVGAALICDTGTVGDVTLDFCILDEDGDGVYDTYYNKDTGVETDLEQQEDGKYLIDDDGDGDPDYVYDVDTGELTAYTETTDDGGGEAAGDDYTWLYATILVVILLLLAIGAFLGRKKPKEPAKPNNKANQKSKKK